MQGLVKESTKTKYTRFKKINLHEFIFNILTYHITKTHSQNNKVNIPRKYIQTLGYTLIHKLCRFNANIFDYLLAESPFGNTYGTLNE